MEQVRAKSRLRENLGDILGGSLAVGVMHGIDVKHLIDRVYVNITSLLGSGVSLSELADDSPLQAGRLSYAALAASGFLRGNNSGISSALSYAGVAGVAYSTLQNQNTNSLDDYLYAATAAGTAYLGGYLLNVAYNLGRGAIDYFKRKRA